MGRKNSSIFHHEDVCGIGFGYEAFMVKHKGVSSIGIVCLNFWQDIVYQVAMMDFRIYVLRRVSPVSCCDE